MEQDPTEAERWARFGSALAEAMPKSRLRTQKALAAHLGVDQTLVSAWTRGTKLSRMTPARVTKLEQALGAEAVEPGSLVSILFGSVLSPPSPDQLETRLATIEAELAANKATLAQILKVVTAADHQLRDQGK